MPKAKNSSADEEVIFQFLQRNNRPYSVQNIVDSLQKQGIKKTAVERSLASLVERKLVTKKEYGKAKIFLATQGNINIPDAEAVEKTETELRELTESLEETTKNVALLRQRRGTLAGALTLDEARHRVKEVEDVLAQKKGKRGALGDASNLFSKEDKMKLETSYFTIRQKWKAYRRIVIDIADRVSEATGRKRTDIYSEIGIETDEQADISYASMPDMQNPAKRARSGGRIPKRRKI